MSRALAVTSTSVAPAPVSGPMLAMTAAVGMATVLTTVLSNGNLVAAVAPVVLGAIGWFVWVAPLRTTLGLVMLLGFCADRPGDTDGHWASVLQPLGGLLFHNLNHTVPIDALKFSGVFALAGVLLVVRAYRTLTGRVQDSPGSLTLAPPMRWALGVGAVTACLLVAWGAIQGGDVQSAKVQVQAYFQLLAVAYLFGVSMRGSRDYRWLGGVVVAGAVVKSLMALWVRATLPGAFPDNWGVMRELEYATNHGDSLLFTVALALLIGPLFHHPTRRQVSTFALVAPIVMAGVVANDRRVAWVQVGLVVLASFLMNPAADLTRAVRRLVASLAPLLVLYGAVGWFSPSRIFAPVGFVRNILQPERTDGSLDRSTLFRDVENFNLVQTFMSNPVLGTGFGHPFLQAVEGDALPDFTEYGFLPHNSVLGLWAFTGAVGFTGLMAPLVVGMLLAVRARARATTTPEAVWAVVVLGCFAAFVVHLWADIGFTEAPAIFLVGLALAVAGQLAVTTGDWPSSLFRVSHPGRDGVTGATPGGAIGHHAAIARGRI